MLLLNRDHFAALLAARGWTAAAFARHVGLTPATIHRLMRGTRRVSPVTAHLIARALDQPITELFGVPLLAR